MVNRLSVSVSAPRMDGSSILSVLCLVDSDDKQQQLFLDPDGCSIQLASGSQLVQVISTEAPWGKTIFGKCQGDEVFMQAPPTRQIFEVLRVP